MFFPIMAFAYLIGAIPFDAILVKKMKGIDIRSVGSGNAGATNVKRILGWKGMIISFLVDSLKGIIPVWLTWHVLDLPIWQVSIVGLMSVIGHVRSIFFKFKGGKGVSVTMGIFFVLNPLSGIISLVLWFTTYELTKLSALGSLFVAFVIPITQLAREGALMSDKLPVSILSLVMGVSILYLHRGNLHRLWHNKENTA